MRPAHAAALTALVALAGCTAPPTPTGEPTSEPTASSTFGGVPISPCGRAVYDPYGVVVEFEAEKHEGRVPAGQNITANLYHVEANNITWLETKKADAQSCVGFNVTEPATYEVRGQAVLGFCDEWNGKERLTTKADTHPSAISTFSTYVPMKWRNACVATTTLRPGP